MNKKTILIFAMLFLLVGLLPFVLSSCCVELKNGDVCVDDIEQEDCLSTIVPTSCNEISDCQFGICIDQEKGDCLESRQISCEEKDGGLWDDRPIEEIEINGVKVCQEGCCIYGNTAEFITHTECMQISSDERVKVKFHGEITNFDTCMEAVPAVGKGACLFEEGFVRDCKIYDSKEDCVEQGGTFKVGLLCTAQQLATNCAKTTNTKCGDDNRVYFLDSCTNYANVYDSSKYDSSYYWTYIQDPLDINSNLCLVEGEASSDCGNCNYISGTMCKEYKAGRQGMPSSSPDHGDYVCADLGCYYDTDDDGTEEYYRHGEYWCAEPEGNGIYNHIKTIPDSREFLYSYTRTELENPLVYNLPGNEYTMLGCNYGEVIPERCGEMRNEICVEFEYPDGFKDAECRVNNWRACPGFMDEESCESVDADCKWIPGYRFDGEVVTKNNDRNMSSQGSCVPLFAPGLDFWSEDSNDWSICSNASIVEETRYETPAVSIKWGRDRFEDMSVKDAAYRCLYGCYAIPGYAHDIGDAKGYPDKDAHYMETLVWQGNALPDKLKNYFISARRGHYCTDKNADATGRATGDQIRCAGKDKKRKDYPIFFTHDEWINSIKERARSLGDCGYKSGAYVDIEEVDEELEMVVAIFQKLKQDGTMKSESESEIIYVGDRYIGCEEGYRGGWDPDNCNEGGGISGYSSDEYTCNDLEDGACYLQITCDEENRLTDYTCPSPNKFVCCDTLKQTSV